MYPYETREPKSTARHLKHVVIFGSGKSAVVSFNESKKTVKVFYHPDIPAIKKHYDSIRSRRYGTDEAKALRNAWHRVTREIADYIASRRGTVTMVNLKKDSYIMGDLNRQMLNRKLKYWSDYTPRNMLSYKLSVRGVPVSETKFDLSKLAKCPNCNAELGGRWQELLLKGYRRLSCMLCGWQGSPLLAVALHAREGKAEEKNT